VEGLISGRPAEIKLRQVTVKYVSNKKCAINVQKNISIAKFFSS